MNPLANLAALTFGDLAVFPANVGMARFTKGFGQLSVNRHLTASSNSDRKRGRRAILQPDSNSILHVIHLNQSAPLCAVSHALSCYLWRRVEFKAIMLVGSIVSPGQNMRIMERPSI
jgi:hypothetical protein